VRSIERTNRVRRRNTQAMLQGMNSRPNTASRVPTQLARSELARSPCISRAKLVVIPHDGQGTPVFS
jgi:hypothetical protein